MRQIDLVLPKGAVHPLGLFELHGAHPDWTGAPADLLCFTDDPRSGAAVLSRPDRIVMAGRVY